MLLSLLIAVLVGFPGMLLQMHLSKKQYICICFVCLLLACLCTLVSLPGYCTALTLWAFGLIFIIYLFMLLLRSKSTR
jgi:hypothetical protein